MGRPLKTGLDYFPVDLDIMSEDSVAFVDAKYGIQAFGILMRILIRVYRKGYYMPWTETEQYLLARDVSVDIQLLREIVSAYINSGFFHKEMADKHEILTSHGIQKRYVTACERRKKVTIDSKYLLLLVGNETFCTDHIEIIGNFTDSPNPVVLNEDNNPQAGALNEDNNPQAGALNEEVSTQSKVKESKVKESKVYIKIFDHWNSQGIQKHRKLTSSFEVAIQRVLKDYTEGEVIQAIENYGYILSKPDEFFWSYRWSLDEFLKRGIKKFMDRGIAENNFKLDKRNNGSKPSGMPGNEAVGTFRKYEERDKKEEEEQSHAA